jgi:hypothetical protein
MAKGGRRHPIPKRGEVREMRDAKTILGIIRARGRQGLPLEDVYRQLYNPELYLLAYAKIAQNKGAMTPGVTAETADGMSLEKSRRLSRHSAVSAIDGDPFDASTSRRRTR